MGLIRRAKQRMSVERAKVTLRKLAANGGSQPKRRLFVDCGSNIGQGYAFFTQYLRPDLYDAVLIEPNPHCVKTLRETLGNRTGVELIEGAAWTENTTLRLFGLVEDERGETTQGASVVADHNSGDYTSDQDAALDVPAFSFGELLEQKSNDYDHIVVKMDIESSEYEVLRNLLDTGAAKHITHLFIEFHSEYFKEPESSEYRALEQDLIDELRSAGVGVTVWI